MLADLGACLDLSRIIIALKTKASIKLFVDYSEDNALTTTNLSIFLN